MNKLLENLMAQLKTDFSPTRIENEIFVDFDAEKYARVGFGRGKIEGAAGAVVVAIMSRTNGKLTTKRFEFNNWLTFGNGVPVHGMIDDKFLDRDGVEHGVPGNYGFVLLAAEVCKYIDFMAN